MQPGDLLLGGDELRLKRFRRHFPPGKSQLQICDRIVALFNGGLVGSQFDILFIDYLFQRAGGIVNQLADFQRFNVGRASVVVASGWNLGTAVGACNEGNSP